MKKLFFLLVFVLSLGLVGCPKGPSGDVPDDSNDSTQVDSSKNDSSATKVVK